MKLFFQYCSYGFSNCYILGTEKAASQDSVSDYEDRVQQNAAIIVDPGSIEKITLEAIENNNFDLKAVLITHDHLGHVRGLRTLKRIYNAEVFAVNKGIMDYKTNMVKDGDYFNIADLVVEVISIPGHSSDSVVYRIGNLLFTGDVFSVGDFMVEVISIPGHSSDSAVYRIGNLFFTGDVITAGLVGSTASAYGAATQMNKLRSRLLSLPGDYIVLPGHGPPSTLEAERRFNADIHRYEENRAKRPVYKVDL